MTCHTLKSYHRHKNYKNYSQLNFQQLRCTIMIYLWIHDLIMIGPFIRLVLINDMSILIGSNHKLSIAFLILSFLLQYFSITIVPCLQLLISLLITTTFVYNCGGFKAIRRSFSKWMQVTMILYWIFCLHVYLVHFVKSHDNDDNMKFIWKKFNKKMNL